MLAVPLSPTQSARYRNGLLGEVKVIVSEKEDVPFLNRDFIL
jgi:hypothetical protein